MYNMIKEELNKEKSFTENGAVAYKTSGTALVDFNFAISKLRNSSANEIEEYFTRTFFEDKIIAMKFLFYISDVRGGLGERNIFRTCMNWLAVNQPKYAISVLEFIPEYSRWDNLIFLLGNGNDISSEVFNYVVDIISHQLNTDIANMNHNKSISLLAKWMPSENTSSKETRRLASILRTKLNMSSKAYRKILSALRKYLDVTEVKASSNEWDKIHYESVPSKANLKYKNAFIKHDEERRKEYLNSLQQGKTKINAGALNPDDIVRKYFGSNGYWSMRVNSYDATLEELWKNQINYDTGNAIVVRDGSGSMYSGSDMRPAMVATALAIYMAERANGAFKNKFITFSSNPRLVDISNASSLRDKIQICENESECSNTNIEKTMQLILDTAIHNNMKQEEMPDSIIIVSDMQFDSATNQGWYSRPEYEWSETVFEGISRKFEKAGYKLPKIIFWNVADRYSGTIPMQKNELGLVLCSGYSTANMKMVMSNEVDPYKILLGQINTERYKPIENAVKNIAD